MKRNQAHERRRGREIALQALYASTQTGHDVLTALEQIPGWGLASGYAQHFARTLIERLLLHTDDINQVIIAVVKHWDLNRVARVDDCIIRLAACELLACPDIPAAVSINEAIEMAKKYSTEQSGRFVNGILDAIATQMLMSVPVHESTSEPDGSASGHPA